MANPIDHGLLVGEPTPSLGSWPMGSGRYYECGIGWTGNSLATITATDTIYYIPFVLDRSTSFDVMMDVGVAGTGVIELAIYNVVEGVPSAKIWTSATDIDLTSATEQTVTGTALPADYYVMAVLLPTTPGTAEIRHMANNDRHASLRLGHTSSLETGAWRGWSEAGTSLPATATPVESVADLPRVTLAIS